MGGRTPPAPQRRGPRMTSEAGERAERRRRRGGRREGAAARGSGERSSAPRAVPAPRSARASLSAPRLGRPERAPRSAASAARSSPAPAFSSAAAAGHAAAGRGRDAAGESGTRAASPSPSGSRTAGRLPSPSSSLPAPPLLLLLHGPAASTMSAGGDFGNPLRKFKLVFLGEQSGKYPAYSLGLAPSRPPPAHPPPRGGTGPGPERPLQAWVEGRDGDVGVRTGSGGAGPGRGPGEGWRGRWARGGGAGGRWGAGLEPLRGRRGGEAGGRRLAQPRRPGREGAGLARSLAMRHRLRATAQVARSRRGPGEDGRPSSENEAGPASRRRAPCGPCPDPC